jgi:F-type H+-transporting ATPase subunit epsilon
MADKTYQLDIVTPEKTAFSDQVEFAVFPGSEGELGILFNHAPLLSRLLPGEIRITHDGRVDRFAISGGFLEARKNVVSVITETAEPANQIDIARAIAEKESAEAELKNASTPAEKKAADLRLKKALARVKVGEKTTGALPMQEKK